MISVLSLGLPFSAARVLILAEMMIHGIQPGPLLPTQRPDIFWGVIASMLVGDIMLVVLNIPMWLLGVFVLVIATVGSLSVRGNMTDVYVLGGTTMVG